MNIVTFLLSQESGIILTGFRVKHGMLNNRIISLGIKENIYVK